MTSWLAFLADFRKKNPKLKGKEVMIKAAVEYKKMAKKVIQKPPVKAKSPKKQVKQMAKAKAPKMPVKQMAKAKAPKMPVKQVAKAAKTLMKTKSLKTPRTIKTVPLKTSIPVKKSISKTTTRRSVKTFPLSVKKSISKTTTKRSIKTVSLPVKKSISKTSSARKTQTKSSSKPSTYKKKTSSKKQSTPKISKSSKKHSIKRIQVKTPAKTLKKNIQVLSGGTPASQTFTSSMPQPVENISHSNIPKHKVIQNILNEWDAKLSRSANGQPFPLYPYDASNMLIHPLAFYDLIDKALGVNSNGNVIIEIPFSVNFLATHRNDLIESYDNFKNKREDSISLLRDFFFRNNVSFDAQNEKWKQIDINVINKSLLDSIIAGISPRFVGDIVNYIIIEEPKPQQLSSMTYPQENMVQMNAIDEQQTSPIAEPQVGGYDDTVSTETYNDSEYEDTIADEPPQTYEPPPVKENIPKQTKQPYVKQIELAKDFNEFIDILKADNKQIKLVTDDHLRDVGVYGSDIELFKTLFQNDREITNYKNALNDYKAHVLAKRQKGGKQSKDGFMAVLDAISPFVGIVN